jgi:hypothetical protein
MKIRNIAIFGAIGVAALALIGAGAAATFTQNTGSSQTVTAGTMAVVLTSPDAPGCTTVADACQTLTLTAVSAPVSSTFDTTADIITVHNTGNIPVVYSSVALSDNSPSVGPNATFASETGVCLWSDGSNVTNQSNANYSHTYMSYTAADAPTGYVIAAGGTDTYSVDMFAGMDSTVCGAVSDYGTYAATSLTNAAQGGSFSETVTLGFTG